MGFPWRKFLNIGTDIAAATVPGGTPSDRDWETHNTISL